MHIVCVCVCVQTLVPGLPVLYMIIALLIVRGWAVELCVYTEITRGIMYSKDNVRCYHQSSSFRSIQPFRTLYICTYFTYNSIISKVWPTT